MLLISSCEKDDFIGNSVEPVKVTKSNKVYSKKRKFRLFKGKTYKVAKYPRKTSSLND
jgi:hypothetical protein